MGWFLEVRVLSEVANIGEALGSGVHEEVGADGVENSGGDDLVELVHFGRLDVDYVEDVERPVDVPQVDAEVVGGDEVLAVAGEAERVDVDVVVLAIGVLAFVLGSGVLPGVDSLGDLEMFGVGDDGVELAALVAVVALARAFGLLEDAPELDGLIIGSEHHEILRVHIEPLCGVDVLVNLHALQVVELGLVALELRVVVEIVGGARALEDNKSPATIAHAKVLAGAVEADV